MPLCGTTNSIAPDGIVTEPSVIQVKCFLKENPVFLEKYLANCVSTDFLTRVLQKKKRNSDANAATHILDLTISGSDGTANKTDVKLYPHLYSIAVQIARAIRADVFYMYVICEDGLGVYEPDENVQLAEHLGPVPTFVAMSKMAVHVSAPRMKHDPRFNKGVDPKTGSLKLCHTIAVPIITESLAVFSIVQFERPREFDSFSREDFDIVSKVLCWVTACVQGMKTNNNLQVYNNLNEYTAQMSHALFENVLDVSDLRANIVTVAKAIVPCDRCTLDFMHSTRPTGVNNDGVWVVDEDKLNNNVVPNAKNLVTSNVPTHITIGRNAGTTVVTPMLSVPIVGGGNLFGVLRMTKRQDDGQFTSDEEGLLQLLAVYCSLALECHHTYDRLVQKEAKLQTALQFLEDQPVCATKSKDALEVHPYLTDEEVYFDRDLGCFDFDAIPSIPSTKDCKTVFKLLSESDIDTEKLEMCTSANVDELYECPPKDDDESETINIGDSSN